jgi:hypothetical protein
MLTHIRNPSVAKDRAWFENDYIEFESTAWKRNLVGLAHARLQVRGIGTVKLKSTNANYPDGIILKDVLHIPAAAYNIISHKRVNAVHAAEGVILAENTGDPDTPDCIGKVETTTRDGTFIMAYFRRIRLPEPTQVPGQPIPHAAPQGVLKLTDAPLGCTLGESRIEQIINIPKPMFEWITFPQD